MKKIIITIIVLILIAFGVYLLVPRKTAVAPTSGKAVDSATSSTLGGVAIDINNFSFNPGTLSVKVGDTVTWTNNDSVPHTVTSDSDGVLNSPTLVSGQTYSVIFTKPGTTTYHCSLHKMMKGTIIVQ